MLGIDPHRDACVETLHTYLIGNDKYIWHETNKAWCKVKDGEFAVHLQASSVDGLTLPPIRASYLVQYKNSLIGKHFKTLQQLAVFHMHEDLCSPELFRIWKASGELGALLWFHEIELESNLMLPDAATGKIEFKSQFFVRFFSLSIPRNFQLNTVSLFYRMIFVS